MSKMSSKVQGPTAAGDKETRPAARPKKKGGNGAGGVPPLERVMATESVENNGPSSPASPSPEVDEEEDLDEGGEECGEESDENGEEDEEGRDPRWDYHDTGEDTGEPPGPANNSSSSYNSPIYLNSTSDEEEDDDVGEADESIERDESDEEEDEDDEPPGFLLPTDGDSASIQGIPPDAQARLEAFFEAAGELMRIISHGEEIGQLRTCSVLYTLTTGLGFTDGKLMSDPENLRKLTLTVSSALGEASAAINRMRDSQRKSIEEGRNDSLEEGDSLLALACSSGYFELARVLLAMGANVDDRGSKGDLTPLMDAASQGHLEIVRLLVSHGADVNAQSACGNSPLMYACAAGHEEIVQDLLKAGARVEDNNENGHTPLMEAASAGHVNVARILLQHGAGINTHSNEFKESALTVACYKGHLEMVRFLLEAGADQVRTKEVTPNPPNVTTPLQQHKTDEMHTALMEASMDGHVEVARLLLDSGAQVNMPADSFESPLTLAACGGHVELAELLIERGANIEEVNDEGYTPLMEAAREGHLKVVQTLITSGAKINAETEETHETALTLAACGGFLEVVDTLCSVGASIELGASTPLMEAAQEGHVQVVKYLLDRNADINRTTQSQDTALSYACENGHAEVVEHLISKGADPEHVSEGGRSPLMKACRGGHLEVIKYLITKGAEVNRETTNNDHTPLSLACAGGHLAAVEALLAAGGNLYHKLKDNSTMIIEAARGGHANVIKTLLDFPPRTVAVEKVKSPPGKPPLNHKPGTHPADSSKSGVSQNNQAKSVLRKSRSTSTLDSPPVQQPKSETSGDSSEKGEKPAGGGGDGRKKPTGPIPTDGKMARKGFCPDCVKNPENHSEHVKGGGPPLVPSQVTASTAISERPKAKASKPSARKQAQLQQQQQQQLLQQQGSSPPEGCKSGIPPPPPPLSPNGGDGSFPPSSALLQMQVQQVRGQPPGQTHFKLDPKQLSQIFAQHQQFLKPKSVGDEGETENLDLGQLIGGSQGSPYIHNASIANGTTISVVVANEGEASGGPDGHQPNEMIINATTACYSPSTPGYHVMAGQGEGKKDPSTFPPPLPESFSAAAVAAGLVRPTGAKPKVGKSTPTNDAELAAIRGHVAKSAIAAGVGVVVTGPGPASRPSTVGTTAVPAKKAQVKRSRPFGPVRQSNQQTQTGPGAGLTTKQNHSVASTQTNLSGVDKTKTLDVNTATDSNGETSLSIAAASGHYEVVEFLIGRKAQIEHRDKKGCTPVILAADGGHDKVVELLLNHGAEIEAQSERTKDTALSLACTKGRYEVVELLLKRGANKEHRNVSDYTPLSLAASGGYVNIIKLLLQHGAEINSRTGSKLGISPLMLAAMNGNTAAVKLLLDMGSDINAQIETNKNTALTLACFQGRQEVVSLLLERKANLEHRAKTGLTPLMEAANGGYTEVGKVLLDKGADVNAPPVPATRDTALTIAADKGHYRFVELLLSRGAIVDVRNKKGCTPLWLAAHGGHLDVSQSLYRHGADLDAQDNRRISCLMAAFRKGHVKVIRWIVKNVQQFPSDVEMSRYLITITGEVELLKKSNTAAEYIKQAKDKQALEANKNASILLEELETERSREESKRLAAARRREKKKKKKQEKKQAVNHDEDEEDEEIEEEEPDDPIPPLPIENPQQGSNVSDRLGVKARFHPKVVEIEEPLAVIETPPISMTGKNRKKKNKRQKENREQEEPPSDDRSERGKALVTNNTKQQGPTNKEIIKEKLKEVEMAVKGSKGTKRDENPPMTQQPPRNNPPPTNPPPIFSSGLKGVKGKGGTEGGLEPLMGLSLHPQHIRPHGGHSENHVPNTGATAPTPKTSPPTGPGAIGGKSNVLHGRKDEGWKEVTRNCTSSRSKKINVPSSVISRVIGRGGCNINAIREATGAHIEVEKQQKGAVQLERTIQIKGTVEATKQAHNLITALMNEPDLDVKKLLPSLNRTTTTIPFTITPTVFGIESPCIDPPHPNGPIKPLIGVGIVKGSKASPPQQQQIKSSSSPPPPLTIKPAQPSPPLKKEPLTSPATSISNLLKGGKGRSIVFTPSVPPQPPHSPSSGPSFASKLTAQTNQKPPCSSSSSSVPDKDPSPPPRVITPNMSPTGHNGQSTHGFHQHHQKVAERPVPLQKAVGKPVGGFSPVGIEQSRIPDQQQQQHQQQMNVPRDKFGVTVPQHQQPGQVKATVANNTQPQPTPTILPSNDSGREGSTPMEYSPFNYTFSKPTSNWFEGGIGSGDGLGLGVVGSGASRAMNFASVAASGIPSSTINTTAQMNSSFLGPSLGNGLGPSHNQSKFLDAIESDVPKADASKAPGYRGNTTMSSPILRMQQQQQVQQQQQQQQPLLQSHHGSGGSGVPGNFGLDANLTHFQQLQHHHQQQQQQHQQQQQVPPAGNSYNLNRVGNNHNFPSVYSQQSLQESGNSQLLYNNTGSPGGPPNASFSRLNPRAPSFKGNAFCGGMNHQQIHQFKTPNQFPQQRLGRPAVSTTQSWNSYGQPNEGLIDFQLANLGPGQGIDPQGILSNIDAPTPLQDNQRYGVESKEDRRFPRPIGGERAWKNTSGSSGTGGSIGNMSSFSGLELDSTAQQLPPPIPGNPPGPHHGQPPPQTWMNLYGSTGNSQGFPPQSAPPAHLGQQNPHGPRDRDSRNFLGRRFMEEIEPRNLIDFQQLYDGQRQVMNGGPMLHMAGTGGNMYPYQSFEHMEQHLPKMDQQGGSNSWDSHLIMEEKHSMGWGGNKWGN